MELVSLTGSLAAIVTAASNGPQAFKTWKTHDTEGLSLKMLCLLLAGLLLWTAYGLMRGDWFIVAANSTSAALIGYVLSIKIWNRLHGRP
ncbi:MAG: SemiSWEET family sugar transporter [Beijerinckiaceae bacterium]